MNSEDMGPYFLFTMLHPLEWRSLFFVFCFCYSAPCLISTVKKVKVLVRTYLNEKVVAICHKLPHTYCLSFATMILILIKYIASNYTWLCTACSVIKDCYHMLALYHVICHGECHTRCISLDNHELSTIMSTKNSWYCVSCISSMLPFVHIQDESEFQDALCVRDSFQLYWDSFSENVFNLLTGNDKEMDLPLDDLDPDTNFYNDIAYHSSTFCKYYVDDGFVKDITVSPVNDGKPFSLCHVNVRSLQSNFNSMMSYLSTLEFGFSAVCVTETWLHDSNCNLYNLPGYISIENYRTLRSGVGVGIYLKDDMEFKIRKELVQFNDLFESVFMEIANEVFEMGKKYYHWGYLSPPGNRFASV